MSLPYSNVRRVEFTGGIYEVVVRQDVLDPKGTVAVFHNGQNIGEHEALPSEEREHLHAWGIHCAQAHAAQRQVGGRIEPAALPATSNAPVQMRR